MIDRELMDAISQLLDVKLTNELGPIKYEIKSIKEEVRGIRDEVREIKAEVKAGGHQEPFPDGGFAGEAAEKGGKHSGERHQAGYAPAV